MIRALNPDCALGDTEYNENEVIRLVWLGRLTKITEEIVNHILCTIAKYSQPSRRILS